jgi:hypothetical protein
MRTAATGGGPMLALQIPIVVQLLLYFVILGAIGSIPLMIWIAVVVGMQSRSGLQRPPARPPGS